MNPNYDATKWSSSEHPINDSVELRSALARISFVNTVIDFKWCFRFSTFSDDSDPSNHEKKREGWLLWVEFERPDTHTGKVSIGRGRDEIVWKGTMVSSVIKTAWVLVEMIVKHELMEGFRVDNLRIFDPHNTITDLQMAQKIGTRAGDQ